MCHRLVLLEDEAPSECDVTQMVCQRLILRERDDFGAYFTNLSRTYTTKERESEIILEPILKLEAIQETKRLAQTYVLNAVT